MARIIIVDDDKPFREMLTEVLANEGHEILDASDGSIGMEVLILNPVDLAIVDLIMPNRNGLETINDISKLFPNTKVIAISGGGSCGSDGGLETAKSIGAHYTLPKPFRPIELIKIIHDLLQ